MSPVTFSAIVSVIVSIAVFVVALLTFSWRLRREKAERERWLRRELIETLDGFKSDTVNRIAAVDDKRREDVKALHARIYELENRAFVILAERIGKVEQEMSAVQAELRGATNILRIIQESAITKVND